MVYADRHYYNYSILCIISQLAVVNHSHFCYHGFMYTLIVITHITTMIASVAFMLGAVGLGVFGKQLAVKVASVGMGATVVGFATGLLLMIESPLTLKCALLTSYLVAVTAFYWYGYRHRHGNAARFVRTPVKN